MRELLARVDDLDAGEQPRKHVDEGDGKHLAAPRHALGQHYTDRRGVEHAQDLLHGLW